jgi:hypothetical protein
MIRRGRDIYSQKIGVSILLSGIASVECYRSCETFGAECTGDSWTIETIISRDSLDNASRMSQKLFRHCYKGSILREVGI